MAEQQNPDSQAITNPTGIPGRPDFGGMPNQHIGPEQRAGEIAYYLQMAQQECRADANRVEDTSAQQLFEQIAGLLDEPIKALFDFQAGNEQARLSH